MAKDLRIKVSSDVQQAINGLKKVGQTIDSLGTPNAEKSIASLGASILSMGAGAAASILTVKKLVATTKEAVELYTAQAKEETALAVAIKATGQEASFSVLEIKKLAEELQGVTTYASGAILPIAQILLQTKSIGQDIMPQATEAALDLATAMGTSTTDSARKLAQALADPVRGITILRSNMVTLSPESQATIRQFAELGDVASAQKVILDELAATYGGLAREQGSLGVAKLEQIKNVIGDIKTNLGQSIIESLNPSMTWLLAKLDEVNTRIYKANLESGIIAPTEMSEKDLHETFTTLSGRVDKMRGDIARSVEAGVSEFSLQPTREALNQILPQYQALADELNKRAKEAGWKSSTLYWQSYLEEQKANKLKNPSNIYEEMFAIKGQGYKPSSVRAAITYTENQDELTSAQESAYALVTQTAGYQKIILAQEIEKLKAIKESNLLALENKTLTKEQIQGYKELNLLIDEQLESSKKALEGKTDLESFIELNSSYAKETAEQEQARLQAAYELALAYQLQADLTDEQLESISQITTGLQEALSKFSQEGLSDLETFLNANTRYAKETSEQEIARLTAALELAKVYQLQNDLTQEQGEALSKIINGLEKSLDVTKSVREVLEDTFEKWFPTTGIKAWARDAQSAISDVTSFVEDNFGQMIKVGVSFYQTLQDAQKRASEAQIKALDKQITAEKKLYEKQTKNINSQYEDRTKSLADKYAWGLLSYEDFISGQLALDEEKATSEEAAARRFKDLEKQKEQIQADVAKKAFDNQKAQAIAQSLILGAQAILQGYATLGPIGGSIAAAVIAGVTAAQIATISAQQFTPATALAEGGVVHRPTVALIGEGGEPEAVVPLSKASQFGFNQGSGQVVNVYINAPTYSGDQLAESIAEGIARGQRVGRIGRFD